MTNNVTRIARSINYLRILSILVMLWFITIFSIERIDYHGESLLNLPNSTYIITAALGLLFLLLPNLHRIPFLVAIAFVFLGELALYVILDQPNPVPKIFLVQMGLHTITLLLTWLLSIYLHQVEEGLDSISLTNTSYHILPYDDAIKLATEELSVHKQHKRPLAVIYCMLSSIASEILNLPSSADILQRNLDQMFETRKRQVELGKYVMGLTHVGDIIFEYRNGIVVCLLESSDEEAEKFAYRLHRFVNHFHEWTLWIGRVNYAGESDSIESLLHTATNNITVYEAEDNETLNASPIVGDVRVGFDERLNIELASSWVNKLAHQSVTSRMIYQPIKRAIDLIVASMIILLIAPVLIVVAFLILVTDGRPIFFKQDRVGLGGKTFKMYKFRSMYRDAKPLEPVIVQLPDGTIREDYPDKTEDDPRITPVGRFIRRWSIDELPQLWNVVNGDMSLVGPRPSSWGLEKHTLLQTARLTVKPGITGLWQVSARDNKNFDERLLWDLKYVQKMSLTLDLLILLRTFSTVLRKTGV